MKTVWKFPLMLRSAVQLNPVIELPRGARVIDLSVQEDTVFAWALVDGGTEVERRQFHLRQTGSEIDFDLNACRHLGNASLFTGQLVFHVWEVAPKNREAVNVKEIGAALRSLLQEFEQLSGTVLQMKTRFDAAHGTADTASVPEVIAMYDERVDKMEKAIKELTAAVTAPSDMPGLEAVRQMFQSQIVALEERVKTVETGVGKKK